MGLRNPYLRKAMCDPEMQTSAETEKGRRESRNSYGLTLTYRLLTPRGYRASGYVQYLHKDHFVSIVQFLRLRGMLLMRVEITKFAIIEPATFTTIATWESETPDAPSRTHRPFMIPGVRRLGLGLYRAYSR